MWNYCKTILPVASKLCLGYTTLQLNLAVYNVIFIILIFTVDLCTGFMCRIDKKGKNDYFIGPINAKLQSNHTLLKIAVTLIGYYITYDEYYILTTVLVLEIICVGFLCVKILICDKSSLWAYTKAAFNQMVSPLPGLSGFCGPQRLFTCHYPKNLKEISMSFYNCFERIECFHTPKVY